MGDLELLLGIKDFDRSFDWIGWVIFSIAVLVFSSDALAYRSSTARPIDAALVAFARADPFGVRDICGASSCPMPDVLIAAMRALMRPPLMSTSTEIRPGLTTPCSSVGADLRAVFRAHLGAGVGAELGVGVGAERAAGARGAGGVRATDADLPSCGGAVFAVGPGTSLAA